MHFFMFVYLFIYAKKYFILRKNVLYLTFCKLCQKKVVSLCCETKTKFSHVYYSLLKHVRKCFKSRNYFMDILFIKFSDAQKRLANFFDIHCHLISDCRRFSKAYSILLYAFENHITLVRPCLSRFDYTFILLDILDEIGIHYFISNDAPRRGKSGNYIQLYLC